MYVLFLQADVVFASNITNTDFSIKLEKEGMMTRSDINILNAHIRMVKMAFKKE